MNNKRIQTALKVVVVAASIFLIGCAQYQWEKFGATQDDFNRDTYQCQIEAAQAYPTAVVTQQLTSGYTTPATTNCTGSGSAYGVGSTIYGSSTTNCTTTPGQRVAPITFTSDGNQANRQNTAKACMVARGYSLVQSGQQSGREDCRANERIPVRGAWVCP